MPSVEVAELLVSHICWSNNLPVTWKFLEKALTLCIVPPLSVLALLSDRVISSPRRYPAAYRLYMELLKRDAFSLPSLINGCNYLKIMESIDDVFQFRQIFVVQSSEPGHLLVEFIFATVWELLDASLDDEGLLEHTLEKKSRWPIKNQDMEVDYLDGSEGNRMERQAALSQNLRLLTANSASLRNSRIISPETLLQLTSDTRKVLSRTIKMSVISTAHISSADKCNGTSRSTLWLPIDLYLKDAMDGSQVRTISAAETLTGLVKALHALNQTTWLDAFLGLWTAALRLVQRERNSIEGPLLRLDTCLCMLLSIVTLSVVNIVGEEEIMFSGEVEQSCISQKQFTESVGKRRENLVSSLQRLDDFEGLLSPPSLASSLAKSSCCKSNDVPFRQWAL